TPSGRVTVLDVDSSGGSYADVKNAFRAAKDLIAFEAILHGARDGGAAAVRGIYNATLVPPFCLMAVTSFFDAHGAPSPSRCPSRLSPTVREGHWLLASRSRSAAGRPPWADNLMEHYLRTSVTASLNSCGFWSMPK